MSANCFGIYTVDGETFMSIGGVDEAAAYSWLESWSEDDWAFYFPDHANREAHGRVYRLRPVGLEET